MELERLLLEWGKSGHPSLRGYTRIKNWIDDDDDDDSDEDDDDGDDDGDGDDDDNDDDGDG